MNLPWTGGRPRLAAHAYVWVPTWTTANGADAARRAAALGFEFLGIPLKDPSVVDVDATRADFEAAGVTPIVTSNLGPENDISSPDPAVHRAGVDKHLLSVAMARDLGAPHMSGILYSAFHRYLAAPTAINYQRAAEGLAQVASAAADAGITVSIEIVNRYESNLVNTVSQGLAMVEAVGSNNLYLHVDTFHLAIEEDSLPEALDRALPRLGYFELDQNNRGPLTRGSLDVANLLDKVLAAGFTGLVGIEGFSGAIATGPAAAGVAAWRPLHQSGDEFAADALTILSARGLGRAT